MSQAPTDPTQNGPESLGMDAAQQSLSDALRVSFRVLKFVMAGLMIFYIFSGFFIVEAGEMVVRYRFGEEIGTHEPGWHFGLPFPIENSVTVPSTTQTLQLNESFWYDNPDDKKPEELANQQLDPLKDNFLITGDTNVIHVQFGVNYRIAPDEVEEYLRNVGTLERANELVQTAAERAMIHYVASASVEDIITLGSFNTEIIKSYTQRVLRDLNAGIEVQQILIEGNNQSMPNQVRDAYTNVTNAQADKARAIQAARRQSNQILGETAGGAHTELLTMIRAYEWALADDNDALATQLRAAINTSFRELRLPGSELLAAIRNYQSASAEAAGNDDSAVKQRTDDAATALSKQLAEGFDAPNGKAISGQIASAISQARAMRYQISNKAEQDYNKYASDLATYRKTPRLLAATRLQETREKVLADVLVQTIVGPITRMDIEADPEVQKEIADADFERRQEEARRKQQEQDE